MITINNIEEMQKYYDKQLNTFVFDDDVEFIIGIKVESDIKACNIKALDINACNIKAWNIKAGDIKAWDIKAQNIDAYDIKAQNIDAWDINANNIDAQDINYYTYCIAYYTFKCKSVKGRRVNSICKCLDREIEYIK